MIKKILIGLIFLAFPAFLYAAPLGPGLGDQSITLNVKTIRGDFPGGNGTDFISTVNLTTGKFFIKRYSTDTSGQYPVFYTNSFVLTSLYDMQATTQPTAVEVNIDSPSTANSSVSALRMRCGGSTWFTAAYNENDSAINDRPPNALVFKNLAYKAGTATPNVMFGNSLVVSSNPSALTANITVIGANSSIFDTRPGIDIIDNYTNYKWKLRAAGNGQFYVFKDGNPVFTLSYNGQTYFPGLGTLSGKADVQYDTSSKEIGYVSSRREDKMNIETIQSTDWLYQLLPSTFERKNNPGKKENGLIADEVEKIKSELCFYRIKDDGINELAGVSYTSLITPMLDQLQKQKKKIDQLESRIIALETKNTAPVLKKQVVSTKSTATAVKKVVKK